MALSNPAERCSIIIEKKGADKYTKTSYPLRYGLYSEIDTEDATLHFNLNHEIIRIIGKGSNWPHPQEWLKRTVGNDWIYYSTGGYTGVFETTGEYYLPNLPYPTNKSMGGTPFQNNAILTLTRNWHSIVARLLERNNTITAEHQKFLTCILDNNPEKLTEKTAQFLNVTGGHISVLPPDTRHVDYNVIPLAISRGCLYKCPFCKVKNKNPFSELSRSEIIDQLEHLANLYARDLANYNSLFLGEHDALQAAPDLICFSIKEAYNRLGFANSYFQGGCNTFLFGSITSLLSAPESLFDDLEKLPGQIFINIGLESPDQETIDLLGKPVSATEVKTTFAKMQNINNSYRTIEITGNFVIDDSLPQNHFDSLKSILRDTIDRPKDKGCIYLSPMQFDKPSRLKLFDFYRYKLLSKVPLFLYTIQRL